MNAKEEIIKMLKEQLEQKEAKMPYTYRKVHQLKHLIAATEAAIFDVPSDEDKNKIIGVATDNRGQYRRFNSAGQYYSETYKNETE